MSEIRAALYCRVSTTEQAEEGYSLQEQEARLRAYADAQGWVVHDIYRDPGFSGAKLDRPGIQRLIEDVKAHRVQRVVTYKLDRLSRSQKDTLYLIEEVILPNGADYASVTESLDTSTPLGMAMIGILSVFAQLEREQIAERMMMGRIASAKEGNWRGGSGVPIGYRYIPRTATEDGRLVIDDYEAAQVREIFRQFLGGKTFHSIYVYCHEHYSTSYGRFGNGGAGIIPNILANRAYIGQIKYCGVWYPGKHEPIIDLDTFQRAQDRLAEYRAGLCEHRRTAYQAKHLLTGLLWCGECGARWAYHTCTYKRRSDGEKRSYDVYTCYTKNRHKTQARADHCSLSVWSASELEGIVWDQVEALAFQDAPEVAQEPPEVSAYRDRIEAIDKQLERLVDLYALGSMPLDVIQKRTEALAGERTSLQEAIEAAQRGSGRMTAAEVEAAVAEAHELRQGGDIQAQRELLQALISRITILPDRQLAIEWRI